MGGWGNMMGGWGYGGYGSGGHWMMGIGMLIFWIGIVVLGVYLFRRNVSPVPKGGIVNNSAMDILRERYARGEMDSAEYLSRKSDLESKLV